MSLACCCLAERWGKTGMVTGVTPGAQMHDAPASSSMLSGVFLAEA